MELSYNEKKQQTTMDVVDNSYQYPYESVTNFDPNLSTAGRFSPQYDNVTYENVILVPNSCHENGLLESQSLESQILDPNQSYILSSSSDPRILNSFVRTVNGNEQNFVEDQRQQQIITTELKTHQQIESYNDGSYIEETNDVGTTTTTQIILRRSPDGRFYQHIQNFVLNNDGHAIELVQDDGGHLMDYEQNTYTHSYDTQNNDNEMIVVPSDVNLLLNNFDFKGEQNQNVLIEHQDGQYSSVVQPTNQSVQETQIMSNENCHSGVEEQHITHQMQTVEKTHDQILLEISMSPLLAAVNDITNRENYQQRQWYRNIKNELSELNGNNQTQNLEYYNMNNSSNTNTILSTNNIENSNQIVDSTTTTLESITSTTTTTTNKRNIKIINIRSLQDEFVDINDVKSIELDSIDENDLIRRSTRQKGKEDNCLMVVDQPVPSRALGSLPTAYLYLGRLLDSQTEYTVFAKKDIPLRTKFGPFEGDVKNISEDEWNNLKREINLATTYPILIIDGFRILETSNENTSNWMRYVRLAETFSQQNLLLYESGGKLFFKSNQFIKSKQELRVGYGKEYAEKYGLKILEPSENEKKENENCWPCFECDMKFQSSVDLEIHLNEHENNKGKTTNGRKRKIIKKKRPEKLTCTICNKYFTRIATFRRHMETHSGQQPLIEKVSSDSECNKLENSKNNLISLAAKKEITNISNKENNSFKCKFCPKSFTTTERLQRHSLVHEPDELKPNECSHCSKRFSNPSALASHIKIHLYGSNLFQCLCCQERFKYIPEFNQHVKTHMIDGFYTCKFCNKKYKEYVLIRKHVRSFHPANRIPCSVCEKNFPTLNKLRCHMLTHSDKKEWLCSKCGKQFKRKDKLQEHIKKIHVNIVPDEDDEEEDGGGGGGADVFVKNEFVSDNKNIEEIEDKKNKFSPKVQPSDYQRFIYKCHDCLLGFKRRGMLVNHLAKRHPNIPIDSVPELNLPILKAQKFYYCQYCNKVYRSSAKRKGHILKYHPGLDLPMSSRQKGGVPEIPGYPNPTFSQTVSTITTHPQSCDWCHKQYASRAKLAQHQRKKHPEHINEINKMSSQINHQLNCEELKQTDEEDDDEEEEEEDGLHIYEKYQPNGIDYEISSNYNTVEIQHHQQQNIIKNIYSNIEDDIEEIHYVDISHPSSNQLSKLNINLKVIGNELNSDLPPHLFKDINDCMMLPTSEIITSQRQKKLSNNFGFSHNAG